MNHYIRAMFERTEVDWARKRRVDNERHALAFREIGERAQIQDAAGWIDRRFNEDCACRLAERLAPHARREWIDESYLDPHSGQFLREQLVRAAVYPRAGEQMITGPEQR